MVRLTINYLGIIHSNKEKWGKAVNYVLESKSKILCVEAPRILTPYASNYLIKLKSNVYPLRMNTYHITDSEMVSSLKSIISARPEIRVKFLDLEETNDDDKRHTFMAGELARVILDNYDEDTLNVLLHEEKHLPYLHKFLKENYYIKNYCSRISAKEYELNELKILTQKMTKIML